MMGITIGWRAQGSDSDSDVTWSGAVPAAAVRCYRILPRVTYWGAGQATVDAKRVSASSAFLR
jgi:hypothetical protein